MRKIVVFFLMVSNGIIGQNDLDFRIHSHNDYLQNVPFWKAFSAGASSLEADIFLEGDSLYVAHTRAELDAARSLQRLYLDPIQNAIGTGLELPKNLQLLIDIKSEPYSTLDTLIKTLENYPSVIDDEALTITISGNRPKPAEYVDYPEYIHFDYQSLDAIDDPSILEKIALISLSFRNFSEWNGKGRLTAEDHEKVTSIIQKAHAFSRPFRFWATPDSKTAWKAFAHLGVDFINTDKPFECAQYLNTLAEREYQNSIFSEVYRPTFKSDTQPDEVKNIILLIGDGNGLSQISATALANNGELSLTQLRSIGFLKTQSNDDFTTDSAGAGTAIATGQKVPNRAIGVDGNGKSLQNITELLSEKGFVTGIVTTDEITGATPSAFYAHQKDRSMSEAIMDDLKKSRLSVFVSSAAKASKDKDKLGDFTMLGSIDEVGRSKKEKIGFYFPEEISSKKRFAPLSATVKNVLNFLERKNKPFFLMAEGAKIDSYAHANDIGGLVEEGIAFDQAVTEALQFADMHQNTLVIITADHETGGLTIPQGNVEKNGIEADFTTEDHTGTMVPIFAYGPRSDTFQGVYENKELFHKMFEALEVSAPK
jgi:alkaline phosphatase